MDLFNAKLQKKKGGDHQQLLHHFSPGSFTGFSLETTGINEWINGHSQN